MLLSLLVGISLSAVPCNQDILLSYGLEGRQYAEEEKLDMCKFVKKSCCRNEDQLAMFKSWVEGGEEKGLDNRFGYHREIYFELLDSLKAANGIAKRMMEKLETKRVSNCKVLAKRVLHFDIEGVASKLKDSIVEMHDFLTNTYRGFYCTLCDGMAQRYFNSRSQKVLFSQKFCRDLTSNSLHFLLYFHGHLIRYMNLVGRLVNSCDHKGNFEDLPVEAELVLKMNHRNRLLLEDCKVHRNDPSWFDSCKKMCQKFNIVKYTKFFEPYLRKATGYTVMLKRRINEIEIEEEREKKFLEGVGKAEAQRILEQKDEFSPHSFRSRVLTAASADNKSITPERLAQAKNMFTDPLIFTSGVNAIIDLRDFASRFDDPGIDYLDNGKKSDVSESKVKAVKKLVKKEQAENRKLKSAPLVGAFAAIALAFSF